MWVGSCQGWAGLPVLRGEGGAVTHRAPPSQRENPGVRSPSPAPLEEEQRCREAAELGSGCLCLPLSRLAGAGDRAGQTLPAPPPLNSPGFLAERPAPGLSAAPSL
ncbi:unnamed protein product [Eretmochelys imbricata]